MYWDSNIPPLYGLIGFLIPLNNSCLDFECMFAVFCYWKFCRLPQVSLWGKLWPVRSQPCLPGSPPWPSQLRWPPQPVQRAMCQLNDTHTSPWTMTNLQHGPEPDPGSVQGHSSPFLLPNLGLLKTTLGWFIAQVALMSYHEWISGIPTMVCYHAQLEL